MDKVLYNKAMRLLSMRDHSRIELYNKLQRYTEDIDNINQLLDYLESKNYLSDERFVESYINSYQKKYGSVKLKYNLIQKVGDSSMIDTATAQIDDYTNAYNLWFKKFGVIADNEKDKNRQIRFLMNKGFSYSVIKRVLEDAYFELNMKVR